MLSGLIGAGFATLLSFLVSRYVMEIDWEFDPMLAISGVLMTAAIVMVVGAAASFDVLFRKPLATLRSQ
jgi:predicted lysophospholipase L1 biosynthesis ABC-type transport system permease subunit